MNSTVLESKVLRSFLIELEKTFKTMCLKFIMNYIWCVIYFLNYIVSQTSKRLYFIIIGYLSIILRTFFYVYIFVHICTPRKDTAVGVW